MTPFRFVSAPFTPMDTSGEIAFEQVKPMARLLEGQGVHGVFVCGTTGEGMSLTMDERMRLAEAWKEASGALQLIVHVGQNCTKDAQLLAEHAQRIGVDGIASIGPCFFEADSARTLSRYCSQIANAASETPFYYYHMPSMARVSKVKASDALVCMAEEIATFAGIKFTHEDVDDYRLCREIAQGRWDIFFGRDELLLEALRAGSDCAVGSTYNFATRLYRDIQYAYAKGDFQKAVQKQQLATEGIRVIINHGGLSALKAMMASVGMSCGPLRLPLMNLPQSEVRSMLASLEAIGYLKAILPEAYENKS